MQSLEYAMPNASRNSTIEGWKRFSAITPPPSLEEINVELETLGLDPVSKRTYDHYRRLVRHGYDHYLPINELDMRVKQLRRAS